MASLVINEDRASIGSYTCKADTRNGSCPNNVYGNFGPKRLTLCKRHGKMYDEETARLNILVEQEHESGLHDEDKQAFAEQHERATWWAVSCRLCKNELLSDEYGVGADQVDEARTIKHLWDNDKAEKVRTEEGINGLIKDGDILKAGMYYNEECISLRFRLALWARVESLMTDGKAPSWNEPAVKYNLVDAYNLIADELKGKLINNQVNNAFERREASLWVRRSTY